MARAHVILNFEVNQTNIKGGCQSGRKKVPFNSKSDLSIAVLAGLAVLSVYQQYHQN